MSPSICAYDSASSLLDEQCLRPSQINAVRDLVEGDASGFSALPHLDEAETDFNRIGFLIKLLQIYQNAPETSTLKSQLVLTLVGSFANESFFLGTFEFLAKAFKSRAGQTGVQSTKKDSYIQQVLVFLYKGIAATVPSSSDLITPWFKTVVVPTSGFVGSSQVEKALCYAITVQLFDLHQALDISGAQYSYMQDESALVSIHRSISQLEGNPEIELAWGILLMKIAAHSLSSGDIELKKLLPLLKIREADQLSFAAQEILAISLANEGFQRMIELYEILPERASYSQTFLDLMGEFLPICTPTKPIAEACCLLIEDAPELAHEFFSMSSTFQCFQLACAKLPASFSEVLVMARMNPFAYETLKELSSYVCLVPEGASLKYEDDGCTAIALQDITVFPNRSNDSRGGVTVPCGTKGRCLGRCENGHFIMWNLKSCGWTLIARLLENAFIENRWTSMHTDALRLVQKTLSFISHDDISCCLEDLSRELYLGDFLKLLEDILNHFLRIQVLEPVVAIMEMLDVLSAKYLNRVCSIIYTCGLLERRGATGFVQTAISSIETSESKRGFTRSWLKLTKSLVLRLSMNDEDQSQLMYHLLEIFTNIVENLTASSRAEASVHAVLIETSLDIYLTAINGDVPEIVRTYVLTSFLSPSAHRLTESLLSFVTFLDLKALQSLKNAINILKVFAVALKASHLYPTGPGIAPWVLTRRLYQASKHLVDLFVVSAPLRSAILMVANELISQNDKQHLSLSSHLGPESLSIFFEAQKCILDSHLCSDEQVVLISGLICRAVSSDQEGLISYIIDNRSGPKQACPVDLLKSLQNQILRENSDNTALVVASILTSSILVSSIQTSLVTTVLQPLCRFACRFIMNYPGTVRAEKDNVASHAACTQSIATLIKLTLRPSKDKQVPGDDLVQSLLGPTQLLTLSRILLAPNQTQLHVQPSPPRTEFELVQDELYNQINLGLKIDLAATKSDNCELVCLIKSPYIWEHYTQVAVHNEWLRFCSVVALQSPERYRDVLLQICSICITTTQAADTLSREAAVKMQSRLDFVFYTLRQLTIIGPTEPSIDLLKSTLDLLLSAVKSDYQFAEHAYNHEIVQKLLHIVDLEVSLSSSCWEQADNRHLYFSLLTFMLSSGVSLITYTALQSTEHACDVLSEFISISRALLNSVDPDSPELASACSSIITTGSDRKLLRLYTGANIEDPHESKLADLSLGLLSEWLSVRAVAEVVAGNGLMVALVEAPISVIIQGGNILASSAAGLHLIWRRSLLGLVLKNLQQLGARVAPEAILFVENFRNQFVTCHNQWTSSTGVICQELVEETLSLTILFLLLRGLSPQDTDRLNFWSGSEIMRAIDHLSTHTKYLSTRLMPDVNMDAAVVSKHNSLGAIVVELSDLHAAVKQLSLSQKA